MRGATLFLLDDDPAFSGVIPHLLERRIPGTQITCFRSPQAMLERLASGRPSTILTNCSLDHMDVFDLLKEIARRRSDAATIVMSTAVDTARCDALLQSGAVEVIPKQPDGDMLERVVRTADRISRLRRLVRAKQLRLERLHLTLKTLEEIISNAKGRPARISSPSFAHRLLDFHRRSRHTVETLQRSLDALHDSMELVKTMLTEAEAKLSQAMNAARRATFARLLP